MHFNQLERRELIMLLGGAAVAWPLVARAKRMPRIAVLHTPVADDPEGQVRNAAFLQGLQQLDWIDGRNVRIEIPLDAGDAARICRDAPDVIVALPAARQRARARGPPAPPMS